MRPKCGMTYRLLPQHSVILTGSCLTFSCFLWPYLLYLYYLNMASLVKKIIHGKPYYYLVESRRVDGKPRIVSQKYLGSADAIATKLQAAEKAVEPDAVQVYEFGGVAVMFSLAQELRLLELFNKYLPKRNQGLSVGHYLLLAAINRAVSPRSKRALAGWFKTTSLVRLMPEVEAFQLTSQRFWDHMHVVDEQAIDAIELELSQTLVLQFNLDLRCLIYDATNFFTFIDTFNQASQLAQRGHSKQHRDDLRQVSLALLVIQDCHLPLFHKVYAGNVVDPVAFRSVLEELTLRLKMLNKHCEGITLVFDKGNNSIQAWETLDALPEIHFVGSLPPTQHPDLLAVPRSAFAPLAWPDAAGFESDDKNSPGPGLWVYRTRKTVFGQERTVVVTYHEKLFAKQMATLDRELNKRCEKLSALQVQLAKWAIGESRGGNPPTPKSVQAKITALLRARHMKTLIRVDLTDRNGFPQISYHIDEYAYQQLQDTLLGKTILFTDQHQWKSEEIVAAYRSQYHLENAFKDMKNPHFVAWYPMFHWTDQKIRVHAFYCVIALLLSALVKRKLQAYQMKVTFTSVMRALANIKEIVLIKEQKENRTTRLRLSRKVNQLRDLEQKLYEIFELSKYLS